MGHRRGREGRPHLESPGSGTEPGHRLTQAVACPCLPGASMGEEHRKANCFLCSSCPLAHFKLVNLKVNYTLTKLFRELSKAKLKHLHTKKTPSPVALLVTRTKPASKKQCHDSTDLSRLRGLGTLPTSVPGDTTALVQCQARASQQGRDRPASLRHRCRHPQQVCSPTNPAVYTGDNAS